MARETAVAAVIGGGKMGCDISAVLAAACRFLPDPTGPAGDAAVPGSSLPRRWPAWITSLPDAAARANNETRA